MKAITSDAMIGALLLLAQLCRAADPLDSWTQRKVGNNNYFTSVAFGGGQFVVTGSDTNRTSVLVTSADGANWTPRNSGTTNTLNDVTYGKGKFVAVGDNGTIVRSSPQGTARIGPASICPRLLPRRSATPRASSFCSA
jgi:hypothetical protein